MEAPVEMLSERRKVVAAMKSVGEAVMAANSVEMCPNRFIWDLSQFLVAKYRVTIRVVTHLPLTSTDSDTSTTDL